MEIEPENNDQFVCGVCNLQIWERFMITPCGDTNVCNQCITFARQSDEPKCPTCGETFNEAFRFRQ